MGSLIKTLFKKKIEHLFAEDNCLENHLECENTGVSSSLSRIKELLETKRQTLLAQTETQYAAQNARISAVLERNQLPPLQPPHGPEETSGSFDWTHGQTLPPLKEKGVSNDQMSWTPGGLQRSLEVYDLEDDDWRLTADWSYNRMDNHTPVELRRLPQIRTPVPPPLSVGAPQAFGPKSRVCRLPVLRTKLQGETKRVSGGHRLQTFTGQVDAVQKAALNSHHETSSLAPRPPAAPRAKGVSKQLTPAPTTKLPLPKKTGSAVTPPQPAPPPKPSPPKKVESSVTSPQPGPPPTPAPEKKSGMKQRRAVRPAQAAAGAKKPAGCKPPVAENIELKELKPLSSPAESLDLFFELLQSGNWEKKIKALEIVQALAQHHADTLKKKLVDVCYAVIEEVKNLRSCVAAVAVDTIVYLHVYLQRDMDNMADNTGSALLLKIAQSTANAFLRQHATTALDSLVQNCSPGQVLNVLLRTGLNHLCVAVKVGAAEKLHMLAADLGAPKILKTGKGFTKNFLTAVNLMCVDASSEVRPHGIAILEELASLPNFTELWESVVPEKDRPLLEKILKKIKG